MIRLGPVTRLLALPALWRLGLLLSLIVAIFVAESFTGLLEEALRHDGGSGVVAWLLALQAPEIVDLALAIGMLIAIFFAVHEARNRGELIVLATNGVRWTRVLGFALCFGILGAGLSVAVSGYVIPKARYGERISKAQMRADYILSRIQAPGPQNTRQTIQGTTFIATSPTKSTQERGQLFVFQPGPHDTWRIGQSQDWTVEGPNAAGEHAIVLRNLSAYSGAFRQPVPRSISTFIVENAGMDFHLAEVTSPPDYAFREYERFLTLASANSERLTSIGSRALLVPTAALLALMAVLLSGAGLMRFLSLPLAAVTVLFYDVLGRTLIAEASLSVAPLTLVLLSIAAYLLPPLLFILWRGEAIMIPSRGKT